MTAILLTTLKEAMRKKTFVIIGVVTVLYLIFWSILLHYFSTSAIKSSDDFFSEIGAHLITQMGLQFASMLMALLTIMLSAGAISTELETGLVHAILTRPLRRNEYVLGKLLGLACIVVAYATALFTLLLSIGALFRHSTIMAMTADGLLKGWLLFCFVPLAVLCLTLYGSISLKTVPNGILMIFIYILGNVGGMVEMVGKYINSEMISGAGIFISLISPFQTIYSEMERFVMPSNGIMGDLMRSGGGLSGSGAPASIWMYVYTVVYMFMFVYLAMRKFGKKDIV